MSMLKSQESGRHSTFLGWGIFAWWSGNNEWQFIFCTWCHALLRLDWASAGSVCFCIGNFVAHGHDGMDGEQAIRRWSTVDCWLMRGIRKVSIVLDWSNKRIYSKEKPTRNGIRNSYSRWLTTIGRSLTSACSPPYLEIDSVLESAFLFRQVPRAAHHLRGTAPYWHKRNTELNAMVQQLRRYKRRSLPSRKMHRPNRLSLFKPSSLPTTASKHNAPSTTVRTQTTENTKLK